VELGCVAAKEVVEYVAADVVDDKVCPCEDAVQHHRGLGE
jgi:hypothetical protein